MTDHQQSQNLISALGTQIGIADLALDADGSICLGFDDITFNIDSDALHDQFVAYALLSELPAQPSEKLLRDLLALNHTALLSGPAGVGVDIAARKIFYVERISWRGIDGDAFCRIIENMIQRYEALKAAIGAQDFGGSEDPGPQGDDLMMRI